MMTLLSRLFMSTMLLLISLLSSITMGWGNLEARIVNGIPTLASNYPFIVDIRAHFPKWQKVEPSFCTGSLIQLEYPATILTAGHCLYNITTDLAVYLLRSDQDANLAKTNNFTFHSVWKYVIHENYDDITLNNDIGLIFLKEDISHNKRLSTVTVQSIDSDTECCSKNDALQVIGYGADYDGGNATDTLEYTNKVFMERVKCNQVLHEHYAYLNYLNSSNYTNSTNYNYSISNAGSWNLTWNTTTNDSAQVNEYMICAIGNNTDSCHGDSGGPLIKTGTTIQVGITSYGVGCNEQVPAVYTNLGIYNSWINAQLEHAIIAMENDTTTTNVGATTSTKPATTLEINAAVTSYNVFFKLWIWMMLLTWII